MEHFVIIVNGFAAVLDPPLTPIIETVIQKRTAHPNVVIEQVFECVALKKARKKTKTDF